MDITAIHTYGKACRLAPVTEPDTDDPLLDGIPPVNAQFFYHSLVPLDDPLSVVTLPTASDKSSSKAPLRPFSHADNNALERAWLSLATTSHRASHKAALSTFSSKASQPSVDASNVEKFSNIVNSLARKHAEKHENENQNSAPLEAPLEALADTSMPVCCQALLVEASNALKESFCELTRRRKKELGQKYVVEKVMALMGKEQSAATVVPPRLAPPSISTSAPRTEGFVLPALSTSSRGRAESLASNTPVSRSASTESPRRRLPMGSAMLPEKMSPSQVTIPARIPLVDDGISGKPFVRVEGELGKTPPSRISGSHESVDVSVSREDGERQVPKPTNPLSAQAGSGKLNSDQQQPRVHDVPVGVSRLHMVSLPALQMKPIYWSPVNDIAVVSRATWFYRDTMIPIEAAIANQLEAGYRELRPFSQTWEDEVRCAVEVGADGEEKVSWPLWPKPFTAKETETEEQADPVISSDPFCAAHCFRGEAAAEGTLEPVVGGVKSSSNITKLFSSYHVIYKDASTAFLLKPSLAPSAYYGRKPVSKIMKGLTIGTPVVRGFDRVVWNRLHQIKDPVKRVAQSHQHVPSPDQSTSPSRGFCPGCEEEKIRGEVSDLVLVAHGIGQKFAERVESFHFTHAVTAFRRFVNTELATETVKSVLREDFSGIMVLPINWRHKLSLEDGGPMSEEQRAVATESYNLKDIEPGTIPAVRGLISDVMFDIPFYMSHHKPKMIQALVAEANRVYRLWCRNNPVFRRKGRVHLIAHSLGSVMALEVLSKQPDVPPPLDLSKPMPETGFFEFDTTNLFLLGSPAGFFLLLERGNLVPRKGRRKPGAEASDTTAKDVVGEAGSFGCLAVDNIYNVLAKEDPIAYLLNGTIDPVYAEMLKVAHVPSMSTSWFKSMGNAMRGVIPLGSTPTNSDPLAAEPVKPPTFRLPSQLELEVHDFTREDIAERKAFLLNDNGQIDFFLRSRGGPLELQYLNMLSAHSSYWTSRDLVRLLCMEIGRSPGRTFTLPAMRALKITKRDRT
ncbi:DDHD domain-domain-containing protein [Coniella lustricola]|uniref:DDHD domain-domain-containing protein n=1 Tax=Coniella lustricola TaxID=2025994 RepID=A0A2T2ZXS0_9PEZI|nr:DDHD domain-domain-containing protein [Coniella lustricola]